VDGVKDPVPPPLQLSNVKFELVCLSVDVAEGGSAGTSSPIPAGHLTVELGEVGLLKGVVEILQTLHPRQFVAHALKVVARDNLLVHIVEELSAPVFFDHIAGAGEGVDQMPVPVVQVDAQILSEIGQTVLELQVCRSVVCRNLQRGLKIIYRILV
jgi:hypothetical protein